MVELKQLSLMEAAERILIQNKQPMTFLELFKVLSEAKSLSDEQRMNVISQFYADFIASARFIYMGDDMWDLKSRQSIDMWDKDGAYYQEFPEDEGEEAEEEEEVESEEAEEEEEPEEEEVEEGETEEEIDDDTVIYEDEYLDEEKPVVEKTEDFDDEKYNEYMDDYEDMYDE